MNNLGLPGRLITHEGRTLSVSAWARHVGIPRATLEARILAGVDFVRAIDPSSMNNHLAISRYKCVTARGEKWKLHRLIAEIAIGHPLPPKAKVHHFDENRHNNSPDNLVVCPDDAYHRLLHLRMRALREAGNANYRKCCYCKRWDDPKNMSIFKRSGSWHKACAAAAYHQRKRG